MAKRNYMMIDEIGGSDFYETREQLFEALEQALDSEFPVGVFEVIFEGKRVSEMVNITQVMIERCAEHVMSQYEDRADYEWHHSKTPDWLESSNAYETFMTGVPVADANDSWVAS